MCLMCDLYNFVLGEHTIINVIDFFFLNAILMAHNGSNAQSPYTNKYNIHDNGDDDDDDDGNEEQGERNVLT